MLVHIHAEYDTFLGILPYYELLDEILKEPLLWAHYTLMVADEVPPVLLVGCSCILFIVLAQVVSSDEPGSFAVLSCKGH